MDAQEILRMVDVIHRDKNIPKDTVFAAIESALVLAAKKNLGEDAQVTVRVDRNTGRISGTYNGLPFDPDEFCFRIGAHAAKQVILQKIREAERDVLYEEFQKRLNQLVTGVVQRIEGGTVLVSLGNNVEAVLPRSEQIRGESYHANDRIRAVVYDVRKEGTRVKVYLSRTRRQFVERLFEQEIPEVADGIIEIKRIEREPGSRTKVAVSSTDPRVDCVGACVGVRGTRIKNITDELGGERIEIVRWSDDPQELIANALQPAEVEEVILCEMLGRAIALVREDQRSLAIGRNGQNVRLASKLAGWDIEIMTREELDARLDAAIMAFASLPGVSEELAERLVAEGYLTYDDLSVMEPSDFAQLADLPEEQVRAIIEEAERRAAEGFQPPARTRADLTAEQVEASAEAEAEVGPTGQNPGETTDSEAGASIGEDGLGLESNPGSFPDGEGSTVDAAASGTL
ncbi:MAG: transcription termination factor NusA [Thermoguttaceae bacterium]|nr:transcription termination factor NusA [Thermoguttaceae bacterium]MDW8077484.1 transcription termination factor NusA [Thermoguttaceae bacterium]